MAETLSREFEPFWKLLEESHKNKSAPPNLFLFLAKICQGPLIASVVFYALHITVSYYVLQLLIEQAVGVLSNSPNVPLPIYNGYVLAGLLFVATLLEALFLSLIQSTQRRVAQIVDTTMASAIYQKNFRISPKARIEFQKGQVMNMVNIDGANITLGFQAVNIAWSLVVKIIVAVWIILLQLGFAAGAIPLILSVISMGMTYGTMPILQKSFSSAFGFNDGRVTQLREALMGMRVIKYRAMEDFFQSKIMNERSGYVRVFKEIMVIIGTTQVFANMQMYLLPLVAFIIFAANGNTLTPQIVFPVLVMFNKLSGPLMESSMLVQSLSEFISSYTRIKTFMFAEESLSTDFIEAGEVKAPSTALDFDCVSWTFHQKEEEQSKDATSKGPFELNELSLSIPVGSHVAIVGSVGSGKSALFQALIGDMTRTNGSIRINGSIAYCPQQPWIQSGSIQDNIIFRGELDQTRLDSAVSAACMEDDLKSFSDGISTEIGENGISLSGGQKSRLSLARALYKDADIYLLDDPIASLDANVGEMVMQRAVNTALKGKTVLFSTHQLHLLPTFDVVIVMDEGKIAEMGTYANLMSADGVLRSLVKTEEISDSQDLAPKADKENSETDDAKADGEAEQQAAKFMVDEEQATGKVGLAVYYYYMKALGAWFFIILTLSYVGSIVSSIWNSLYLTYVTELPETPGDFILMFTVLNLASVFTWAAVFFVSIVGLFNAACRIHDASLKSLMMAPISFFDTQPVGRILNRMSSDVEMMDLGLANVTINVLGSSSSLLTSAVLIGQTSWQVILVLVITIISAYLVFNFFQKSNRELQRFMSTSKSPLDVAVSESLEGLPTIKAFGSELSVRQAFYDRLNEYEAAKYLKLSLQIWIQFRMGLLTAFVTLAVMLVGTLVDNGNMGAKIGLGLTFSIGFSNSVFRLLVQLGAVEAGLNSVERLSVYATELPKEAARSLESDPSSEQWPTKGAIEFENVEVRYPTRPDHAVIKNLSLSIQNGHKVGIVGRTGSGKSTLVTALFRMMELHGGRVIVDDRDTSKLGLRILRQSMQMIPQDPVLFEGTVRSNLDPETQFTDALLWEALEHVGLTAYVSDSSAKLDMPITQQGANLSLGQRQLFCLARAILVKPKILIMDEATSSVDGDADAKIQEVLRTQFTDTTVISIAHRINTIAGFDRVLVLQDGEKVEYDHPFMLLSDSSSIFSDLTNASGEANAKLIRSLAQESYEKKA